MSWTLSTSGAAIAKAGDGANSTIVASTQTLAKWSDEAEGQLSAVTKTNWTSSYSSVTAGYKPILDDAVSDLVAMRIVSYDMSGYTSRFEATTMLDVLRDNYLRCVDALKDNDTRAKMGL